MEAPLPCDGTAWQWWQHRASAGVIAVSDRGDPRETPNLPQDPQNYGKFDTEQIREIMRLWSLHPRILDRAALVACWREALLAQKVLSGRTSGYRNHPQLIRFRACDSPETAISAFLHGLFEEAAARGYNFDQSRILSDPAPNDSLTVTTGQLDFELCHLKVKVLGRAPEWMPHLNQTDAHPVFRVAQGPIEEWERGAHGRS